MSIFMSYGEIPGESSDANHKRWIDVESIRWGTSRRITSATSRQNDRESSNAAMSDIVIEKLMDSATPALFIEACCGRGKPLVLELTETGIGRGSDVFLRYELQHAIVSGYEVEYKDLRRSRFAEHTRPLEVLTVSFVGIETRYIPYDQNGIATAPIAVGFDPSTNTIA